jgi:flavodoxin
MRAVIVYESMFGNTHAIADAIGKGLEPMFEVVVVPLAEAGRERLGDADLLVVGGPTHFHGMSRTRTRKWAAATAQKPSNRPACCYACTGAPSAFAISRCARLSRVRIRISVATKPSDAMTAPPRNALWNPSVSA